MLSVVSRVFLDLLRLDIEFLLKQCTTHAGMLLGQKDLKFLRNMYAIFFFTFPAYMLRLKVRALTGVQAVDVDV